MFSISPTLLTGMAAFSVVTFVASLIIVPIILARLPSNYFLAENSTQIVSKTNKSVFFGVNKLIQNIVGVFLILAGIAMLVLPGQGVLTILIGLGVTNFPAKYKLERKLVSKKSVFKSLNWMRKRAGKEPFIYPDEFDYSSRKK